MIRRDLLTSVAALVALVPGFVLPFVVSLQLGAERADRALLASSIGMSIGAVIGNAIEVNSIVEFGRLLGQGKGASRAAQRAYQLKILRFAAVVVPPAGVALALVYGWNAADRDDFYGLAAVFLLVPATTAISSVKAGQVIAAGGASVSILVQSLRTVVPLALVLIWPGVPLVLFAAGFCLGELARLLVLTVAARRLTAHLSVVDEPLGHRGLFWQSASLATTQSGPVTDRAFLNTAPAGAISSYEMADKLFYAGLQFVNAALLTRRVARWAQVGSLPAGQGARAIRRDLWVLGVGAAVVAALGALVCVVTLVVFPIPSAWRPGLLWAVILLVSLPMAVLNAAAARLFVIGGRQSLLIRFSLGFTAANAAFDAAFFLWLGAIGIPIATVMARFLATLLYLGVALRSVLPNLSRTAPVAGPERRVEKTTVSR